MKRYSIVVVQEDEETVRTDHIQLYGRSEYEAIGYAIKHRVILSGKIIFINASDCDKLPEISNLEALIAEDRNE